MRSRPLTYIAFGAFSLFLIGCNRGCTTSKTIASESRVVQTSGGNAEVVGRVVDYRHSRRVGQDIFDREVSHTYGLCFDLKFGTFHLSEFFHEGVANPDNVNLSKELGRVQVKISKDQNHIGLGVDGKVVKLVHLYKNHGIGTDQPNLVADGTMDWANLDIESFPSPSDILAESLKKSCDLMPYGTSAMKEFCDDSKPSSKVHKVLLDKWPSCRFAEDYYTEQKLRELSKDKKWRKRAVKRGKKVLKNIEHHNFRFDKVVAFIDFLDEDELNEELDNILLTNWGKKGMIDYTDRLIERLNQPNSSIDRSEREALYELAKSEFTEFERTGESNYKLEASECLVVLNALGDTTTAYNFVENSFGANAKRYDSSDLLEVAFDNYDSYTDYQQQKILSETESTFNEVKDYSRSIYFDHIEELADCSLLKRLMKKYPEDLKYQRVPSRCP